MDITLLISILLLIGCALLIILYPLGQQQASETLNSDYTLEEYQVKYHAMLANIKELTFDHEMGKVSEQDYNILLPQLKQQAAQVRQHIGQADYPIPAELDAQLEALITQTRTKNSNGTVKNNPLFQEVEAELNMLKINQQLQQCTSCQQSLQPDDAFCRNCGQPVAQAQPEPTNLKCPQCGHATVATDAFCANCGTKILQTQDVQL